MRWCHAWLRAVQRARLVTGHVGKERAHKKLARWDDAR